LYHDNWGGQRESLENSCTSRPYNPIKPPEREEINGNSIKMIAIKAVDDIRGKKAIKFNLVSYNITVNGINFWLSRMNRIRHQTSIRYANTYNSRK
jgi:hypothetical protein